MSEFVIKFDPDLGPESANGYFNVEAADQAEQQAEKEGAFGEFYYPRVDFEQATRFPSAEAAEDELFRRGVSTAEVYEIVDGKEIHVESKRAQHPGLAKLMSINTPAGGLTAEEIMAGNPSPAVWDAVAKLTPEQLEHVFIDAVGTFEITHPDYQPPSPKIMAIAEPALVPFFRKITGADEASDLDPKTRAWLAREHPDTLKNFDKKESVEEQAKKLVSEILQKERNPDSSFTEEGAPFHIDVDVAPEHPQHRGYDYKAALAWAKKVCTMPEFEGLLDYAAEGANGYVQVKGMLPSIELVNKFAELYGSGYATEPADDLAGGTQIYFE